MKDEAMHPPDAYHLLMASFPGEDSAGRVVERFREEGAFDGSEIEGEALVSRDAEGQIHVHEKGSAGIGATFGAAAGGLLGLITGPIGLVLLVVGGGVAGGIAGHFAGQAIPVEDLREVGESLHPGSSAYIAVLDAVHADILAESFDNEGARVLNVAVRTEVASALREAVTGKIVRR